MKSGTMTTIAEADVEQAAREWLSTLGWQTAHGPDIAPGTPNAERDDYGQIVLERRLRDALGALNPGLSPRRRSTMPPARSPAPRDRPSKSATAPSTGCWLTAWKSNTGTPRAGCAVISSRVIDYDNPASNHWLAVNQFTVTEDQNTRRPDVVLFVNGLPLGIIELKNPVDEDATIWTAWQQLQTYKSELHSLFSMNEALVVSDGTEARIGTLTAGREWFKPWRTVTGETLADPYMTELQVMLEGVFEPGRFLALIRDFVVFDDDGSGALLKKMAGYHQFHAVRVAVDETLRAAKLQRAQPRIAEEEGRYETGRTSGRRTGRPPHRCGVAHPGLRQKPDHGLLLRLHRPRTRDGEPHHRRPHRPQRSWTTSYSVPSRAVGNCSASRPPRRRAAPTYAPSSRSMPGESSSPPSRSSSPRTKGRYPPRPSLSGATSSSSPTKPTAASTILWTGTPATCATRCPTLLSSASPERPSSFRTPTPAPYSATHQRLRHPAFRPGRRHRSHLLREPPRHAGPRRRPRSRR